MVTTSASEATQAGISRPASERPIVVGVDGSAGATAALRWAASEARAHGRPLIVVHAWDTPAFYGYPLAPVPEMGDAVRAAGETCLDEALTEVFGDQRPTEVRRELVQGNAARVLIDMAENASLLVVGARGHGSFTLGSVCDRCVHHASCPVLVVRD
jgi:nucleotide-binding universal stress UspA family protein